METVKGNESYLLRSWVLMNKVCAKLPCDLDVLEIVCKVVFRPFRDGSCVRCGSGSLWLAIEYGVTFVIV